MSAGQEEWDDDEVRLTPDEVRAVVRLWLERTGDPTATVAKDSAEGGPIPRSEVVRLLNEVRSRPKPVVPRPSLGYLALPVVSLAVVIMQTGRVLHP
jgi:hypothetical protein